MVQSKEKMNAYELEHYVPVEKYTGEGFALRLANPKTGDIAAEHKEEVIYAVQAFFESEYKVDVIVHNIVSAVDGVSVYVESVGEPHFYSYAIVPVDLENEEVLTDRVWSQEGQIESAIQGSLYAMAYEEEFTKLDAYLEELTANDPIIGTPVKAIERVKGNGYMTPYYFVTPFDDIFDELFDMYKARPEQTTEELRRFFDCTSFAPEGVSFGIEFYMKEKGTDPNEEIYDRIFKQLEQMEGIPTGEYHLFLNDNWIDGRRGIGKKKNTIEKTVPRGILKQ